MEKHEKSKLSNSGHYSLALAYHACYVKLDPISYKIRCILTRSNEFLISLCQNNIHYHYKPQLIEKRVGKTAFHLFLTLVIIFRISRLLCHKKPDNCPHSCHG